MPQLDKLTPPSTLEDLYNSAFRGCSNLTIINKSSQLLQAKSLGVAAVENVRVPKLNDLDTETPLRNSSK